MTVGKLYLGLELHAGIVVIGDNSSSSSCKVEGAKTNTSKYSLCFKIKVTFKKICGFKVIFRTFSTNLCALHKSHQALYDELGVSIVK